MVETFQKVIIARVSDDDGVVYKNHLVDLARYPDVSIFFLAGPLQGALDYHPVVYGLLKRRIKRFILVIPQRYQGWHPLCPHALVGESDYFVSQQPFEEHYIDIARGTSPTYEHPAGGMLLFNLSAQKYPRTDGQPYGVDTMRELIETYTREKCGQQPRYAVCFETTESLAELTRQNIYPPGYPKEFPLRERWTTRMSDAAGRHKYYYKTLQELADCAADSLLASARI